MSPRWTPERLDLSRPGDRARWRALADDPEVHAHDTLHEQLLELVEIREPGLDDAEAPARVAALLGEVQLARWGAAVYYPWSRRLVRLLPRALFREVRSARNRHKITDPEQAALYGKAIGVAGLSVGRSAAVTLAMEGVAGAFRLADMDALGLSNMNRLRCRTWDLGVNKAILAARELAEIDPWLDVQVFTEGVTRENIDRFLEGLDLIVEEADSLDIKALIRERARQLGLPVVMNTSDRGVTDVERYDLAPDAPMFGGLLGPSVTAADLAALSDEGMIVTVMSILGADRLSTRSAASLLEMGSTVGTWAQLASGVALGGAILTHVARRILLGSPMRGRFYVDLEALIPDAHAPPDVGFDAQRLTAPAAACLPRAAPAIASKRPCAELARGLVAAGVMAPSAHNLQPWRFVYRDGGIDAHLDGGLEHALGGSRGASTLVAMGAAVENMLLTAWGAGVGAAVEWVDDPADPRRVARIHLGDPAPVRSARWLEQIPRRVTNRAENTYTPMRTADRVVLDAAAASAGAELVWIEDAEDLDAIAPLMSAAEREIYRHRALFGLYFGGFRWSTESALATRDGVDITSIDASPVALAMMRMASRWPVAELLEQIPDSGGTLASVSEAPVRAASALVALRMPPGPHRLRQGGRALERVWLAATELELAFQPMLTLPMLLDLRRSLPGAFPLAQRERIAELERQLGAFVDRPALTVCLLRLAQAPRPSVLSLRKPVSEVFSVA